jgi:hypothetical protein
MSSVCHNSCCVHGNTYIAHRQSRRDTDACWCRCSRGKPGSSVGPCSTSAPTSSPDAMPITIVCWRFPEMMIGRDGAAGSGVPGPAEHCRGTGSALTRTDCLGCALSLTYSVKVINKGICCQRLISKLRGAGDACQPPTPKRQQNRCGAMCGERDRAANRRHRQLPPRRPPEHFLPVPP